MAKQECIRKAPGAVKDLAGTVLTCTGRSSLTDVLEIQNTQAGSVNVFFNHMQETLSQAVSSTTPSPEAIRRCTFPSAATEVFVPPAEAVLRFDTALAAQFGLHEGMRIGLQL